jgi:biopolymer transport protein ExbB
MAPLLFIGLLLWFFLGLRGFTLRRGVSGPLAEALQQLGKQPPCAKEGVIAEALRSVKALASAQRESAGDDVRIVFDVLRREMRKYRRAIRAMVMAAPLLGLLGTVMGMIETFASLQQRALFAQSGGVAGGISEALITTQMGLLVAIPGLFAGRWLDRKEQRLATELERIRRRLHLNPNGASR